MELYSVAYSSYRSSLESVVFLSLFVTESEDGQTEAFRVQKKREFLRNNERKHST